MGDSTIGMLENGLAAWNDKLSEVFKLLSTSPDEFRDGAIWKTMTSVFDGIIGVGLALVLLCWCIGVIKNVASLYELKRPEIAVRMLVRLVFTQYIVTHSLDLLIKFSQLATGLIKEIMTASGLDPEVALELPSEIETAVSGLGVISGLGAWATAFLCMILVTGLSLLILLTVYGRFFRIFIMTALAPIPLAGFAGEPTSGMGKSFLRSYIAVLLEGSIILLAAVIFTAFATTAPVFDDTVSAQTMIFTYMGQVILQMLIFVIIVKSADRVAREISGL